MHEILKFNLSDFENRVPLNLFPSEGKIQPAGMCSIIDLELY